MVEVGHHIHHEGPGTNQVARQDPAKSFTSTSSLGLLSKIIEFHVAIVTAVNHYCMGTLETGVGSAFDGQNEKYV